MSSSEKLTGTWTYWRPYFQEMMEMGVVRGSEVGLPVHFHAEDQVTFVLAGRRRFIVRGEVIVLRSGKGTWIPAGTPHSSLPEPGGLDCFNIYLPAGQYATDEFLAEMEHLFHRRRLIDYRAIADAVLDFRLPTRVAAPRGQFGPRKIARTSVTQAALRAGISREAFSRRFRTLHGMSPGAFWAMCRLNEARNLLRRGEAIAAVAAEAGFADQSHLGRSFRRAFGVTPGHYRADVAVTNLPDTAN